MTFHLAAQRDVVLFINEFNESHIDAVNEYEELYGKKLQPVLIHDSRLTEVNINREIKRLKVHSVTLANPPEVAKVIKSYRERLLAIVCRQERHLRDLSKIIPHVPYIHTPTARSLEWTTNKLIMRRLLDVYAPNLNPRFTVIHDKKKETLRLIQSRIGYPVVVKPAGLAASILVSVCYHEEELIETLDTTFKKIRAIYKERKQENEPEVLVEQLLEGALYSIDSYVNERGRVYHCPPVHVKTGRSIGFDDFFGYQQLTPVKLKQHKIEIANSAVEQTIAALGLRSTTTHTELKKTEDGWRVIEITARPGGFRHSLYKSAWNINHGLNDLLIRVPQKPIIPKKPIGFSAAMKFFAKTEGYIDSIGGLRKARDLKSFKDIEINKQPGDKAKFASNGGTSVFNIILHNYDRSELLADIRRLEKMIDIKISSKKPTKKK